MNTGVGIVQVAFRDETLRAVAGYGVAVLEMAMLKGVEFKLLVSGQAG